VNGIDVHLATISVAVMEGRGKLIMECILETKAATILEFMRECRGSTSLKEVHGARSVLPRNLDELQCWQAMRQLRPSPLHLSPTWFCERFLKDVTDFSHFSHFS
jgi:precorrin-6B methylase 2